MPMQKEEAERALQLLWEFLGSEEPDPDQQNAYKEVISGLHAYLTDILPASLPCLRARGPDGRVVEIQLEPNARPQTVDLYCNRGEKLGIVLDKVNLNGEWLSAGNLVSPIMVSLIAPGSAAAKDGRLTRGDQLLEIDGHPLSQCSLERARWLLDRAERNRVARLFVITSGLSEGLKHSVSRDFLDGKVVRQKRSKSMESLSRIHRTDITIKAEVHEGRRALTYVPPPKAPKPKRQSSARSSHSSSFRNHPAYAPSIGSRRDSNASLVSSTVETAAHLARTSFRRSEVMSGGFKKRKVRKMHIMKGERGLGLRIVGGKGSKFGDMGIFVNKLEEGGAAFNDNRLRPGDELLMVNGKSLVGLTHNEAVEVLKATQKLVQLVVATESTEGESVASSLQSIPEAVADRRAYYNRPSRSFSPLSVDSSSASAIGVGPELQQLPQRNAFLKEAGGSGLELQIKTDRRSLRPTKEEESREMEMETKFEGESEEPTSPMEKSDQFEVVRMVTPWARTMAHQAPPPPEPEIKMIVYAKTEGRSLGFSICGGKGSRQGDLGILVRNIDPDGLAAQDGRLRRGDEILDVNGKSLQDCTHKKAAGIIRSMKTGVVTLTVRSGNGTLPRGNTIKRSSLEPSQSTFQVTLVKEAGKPLGLQLAEVRTDTHSSAVSIRKIAPNSPADACTNLKCEDRIITVNNTNVAGLRADKVRAFLSSLPPGDIKLTLQRTTVTDLQTPSGYQEPEKRSVAMGQANASSKSPELAAKSDVPAATVSQAKAVSAKELEDISESESETSCVEEEEEAPEIPSVPPPIVAGDVEMEGDAEDEARPRLHLVISQTTPSRPDSVLMNIDGSLPVFESQLGVRKEEEEEEEESSLPLSPPSPPASENSDWEGDAPTVPKSAPPLIPVDSTHLLELDNMPPVLPSSTIPADSASLEAVDQLHGNQLLQPPSNGPPPPPPHDHGVSVDLGDVILPALPMSMPPLISDYTNSDASSVPPPPPPPPDNKPPSLLAKDTEETINRATSMGSDEYFSQTTNETSSPLDESSSPLRDKGSLPRGYVSLEIDLKKRATTGLGVTLEQSSAPTSDLFMIRRVMAVGAAAKDGRLKTGDRLVAVNGKSLAGLTHATVLQELNNAPKDCHLTVWRDPSFETAAITPTFTGSRTSLGTISDEEEEGVKKFRSLSTNSLDKSPLMKKLSVGRGVSPRGSPLAYSRLQSLTAAGSPLSKRWSAESFPLKGPAGEILDPHQLSPLTPSPDRVDEYLLKEREDKNLPSTDILSLAIGAPPTDTPPQPPGTPPTDMPPQPPWTPPTDTPPQPPGTPPTDTPPHPPGTPPTDTPPLSPGSPSFPSAPPSTMVRGLHLDLSKVANTLGITSESEEEEEEAPPPVPQTTPPPAKARSNENETHSEAPPPLPQTTPPPTVVEDRAENSSELKEVERPKSLGPVPKGRRLDDAPFEIEVSKSLIGGLGLSICENELGMIAVKGLTSRSPITKDGNIRVGDHLISINDDTLLGKRLSEAEAIIKSLPRGPVRIVAMAPPRNVTNGGIKNSMPRPAENSTKPTPSTNILQPSKALSSSVSKLPSVSSTGRQVVDEEGIVRVVLQRYGGRPLGFTIEGGSDTHLKYVYIQSLSVGSPASNCGLFNRGDQLVMVGEHCLVGITHQEAKKIIETVPDSVEIVAQRKQSPKQVPKSSLPEIRQTKPSRSHSGSESEQTSETAAAGNSAPTMIPDNPPLVITVPEDMITVQLFRSANERLGLSIVGGTDNTDLPQVHIKKVLPDGVAGRSGQLKRGDRIVSVNGISLERASNKVAMDTLKNTGNHVILLVARKIGRRVSTATTPLSSRLTSRRGSGDNTQQGSKDTSPKQARRLLKATSSGENSQEGSRGQTPPTNPKRHARRKSLGYGGEVLAFKEENKGSTLPRKVGSKVGVRLVELHKGPTGLGMQIQGGKDRDSPITVKMVISGGVAQKSGKVRPGDVILEANSISFENLTHAEAMKTLKGFPQGKVRLIIRDRTAVAQATRT